MFSKYHLISHIHTYTNNYSYSENLTRSYLNRKSIEKMQKPYLSIYIHTKALYTKLNENIVEKLKSI